MNIGHSYMEHNENVTFIVPKMFTIYVLSRYICLRGLMIGWGSLWQASVREIHVWTSSH